MPITTVQWAAMNTKIRANINAANGNSMAGIGTSSTSSAPGFMGADGMYFVNLGSGRGIYILGDTGVATAAGQGTGAFQLVHNSVILQSGGYDPVAATWQLYTAGSPAVPRAFHDETVVHHQPRYRFPTKGMLLDNGLLLLMGQLVSPEEGFGPRALKGSWACLIDNPAAAPDQWRKVYLPVYNETDVVVTQGYALLDAGDGYVYCTAQAQDLKANTVCRFAYADVRKGRLHNPQWWDGIAGRWVYDQITAAQFGRHGTLKRRRVNTLGFAVDLPGGTLHKRADGQYQLTIMPELPYDFVAQVVVKPGTFNQTVRMALAASPGAKYSSPTTLLTVPESTDTDFYCYNGGANPELTWAGKAANDFAGLYNTNWAPANLGGFTAAARIKGVGFPRMLQVSGA